MALFLAIFFLSFMSIAVAQDYCVTHPYNSSCSSYQISNDAILDKLDSMCSQMGSMPSCTIYDICQSSEFSNDPYCQPFSIFGRMCVDMGSMDECKDYATMCPFSSVIKQCSTQTLPLPSSLNTENYINGICSQMNMDACATCNAPSNNMNCPTLQVYSNLCKAMPDMNQCSSWKMICSLVPGWPLCSTSTESSDFQPIMKMYLHTSIADYVLFKSWIPRTNGQYVGTLIAILIFGITSELLKLLKCFCDSKWTKVPTSEAAANANTFDITQDVVADGFRERLQVPFRWKVEIARGAYRTLESFWGIMVMLLVMTFNVGIIFSYCAGVFIGTVLVGRYTDTPVQKNVASCC